MELGRLTAVFDADTRKFDAGARSVATKVSGLTTSFSGLTGGLGSASSALSGLTSPMGMAAGGAVLLASAIGGLATGLFALIKQSAAAGGELLDLSQKTGFTVETLSTLSIVAKTTGSDIKGLTGSLVIFQKNMEAAHVTTSTQGKLFKSLNIDIDDNEKATRQAFTALFKMGEGARQTATAMQLFGRSGKDVLAIIKETNGNLDEATKKYDKMGLTISTSAATASDKFNDVLEETTLQLSAVTRSIGMELLPTATNALQQISFWLAENKGQWSSWGTTIADVLRGVSSIAQSEIGTIIGWIARLSAEISGLPSLVRGLAGMGAGNRPVEDAYGPGGAMRGGRASLPGTPEYLAAASRRAAIAASMSRGGGGGGGGGRGGGGNARTDPAVQLLKQLEDQLRDLTPRTEAQIAAEKILGKEFAKSSDENKKKIIITAMELDQKKMILSMTRERIVGLQKEREEIEKMVELVRGAGDQGLPFFSRRRTMNDLTGLLGTEGTRPRSVAAGATRPRIATVDEQVAREQIARIREQMDVLAGDLTSIFARSIGDGFNHGVKSGLQTLAQGLLQIVQDIFLKRLATGLSELLGGLATGGSGGGFWGGLLKSVLGAAIGGAAGGAGGGVSGGPKLGGVSINPFARAMGGPVSAMSPYVVGERGPEMFVPNTSGNIVPNHRMGQQVHNHYTINLPPAPNTSVSPRRSARQQADMILAALQGSQA